MTIKCGPPSWLYLFLSLSGPHSFVDSPNIRRQETRSGCLLRLAQKLSPSSPHSRPKKSFRRHRARLTQKIGCFLPRPRLLFGYSMAPSQSRVSLDCVSVQSLLKIGDTSPPLTFFTSHTATATVPTSLTSSIAYPNSNPSHVMPNHPRPKRMSLSFPVALNIPDHESTDTTSPLVATQTFASVATETVLSPADPNSFLVALAGQERRVLELREELNKAEEDLRILKQKWKSYEAQRKRGQESNIELLPSSSIPRSARGHDSDFGVVNRRHIEADRRKALIETLNIPKESRRTFSGAHTRTLSLLSPERSNFNQLSPIASALEKKSSEHTSLHRRNTTVSSSSQVSPEIYSTLSRNSCHSNNVASGTKHLVEMAEDVKRGFKSGMLTFWEDLRQATVGDEGVNGTASTYYTHADSNPRDLRKSRRAGTLNTDNSKRGSPSNNIMPQTPELATSDARPLSNTNLPVSYREMKAPTGSKRPKPVSVVAPIIDELDDPWSIWDSPHNNSPRWSGSTSMSSPATPPDSGCLDRDLKIVGRSSEDSVASQRRDHIPWHGFEKLSPANLKGNLQKTMLTFMKDWETNAMPSPETRNDPTSTHSMRARVQSSDSEHISTQEDVILMSR
ncbi:BgTH12-07429 [Blumeria graminis f. sp. triticale]|uniref:BgTH12-07429 n=1 Tax=Blumeria graminis f. sp. triticale TaxID=1689686 RepID=A0A9W4CX88_BLUGR|nr:BgTH12-07429 [Blumeria graminis f. sp. triticale]